MTDAAIVDLYWARNDEAVRETQKKYGGYCYTIAYNFLRSSEDAEECVNDTWFHAWNAMPENRPTRLGAFVGKITRSLAFDRYRGSRAQKRGGGELPLVLDELRTCIPTVPSAAQEAEDAELEEIINKFLHALPPRDCNIFLRRYWYAEPLSEISKRYGIKQNTIKTVLFRTRNKLKEYLEQEGVQV